MEKMFYLCSQYIAFQVRYFNNFSAEVVRVILHINAFVTGHQEKEK